MPFTGEFLTAESGEGPARPAGPPNESRRVSLQSASGLVEQTWSRRVARPPCSLIYTKYSRDRGRVPNQWPTWSCVRDTDQAAEASTARVAKASGTPAPCGIAKAGDGPRLVGRSQMMHRLPRSCAAQYLRWATPGKQGQGMWRSEHLPNS